MPTTAINSTHATEVTYRATDKMVSFLNDLDGSYEKFARDCGLSSRTIARVRKQDNVSRKTAKAVFKAACTYGLKLSFEQCFDTQD